MSSLKEFLKSLASNIVAVLLLALILFLLIGNSFRNISQGVSGLKDKVTLALSKKEEGKRVDDNSVIAPSEYVLKKDFQILLTELNKQNNLIKELAKKGFQIRTVTQTKVVVQEKVIRELSSDRQEGQTEWKTLSHSNGLYLGEIGFTKNRPKPWDIKLAPLNLALEVVISRKKGSPDRVGTNVYFLNPDGKKIPAPISSSQTKVLLPKKSWGLRFNPFLEIGPSVVLGKGIGAGAIFGLSWFALKLGELEYFRWLTPMVGYADGVILGGSLMSFNLGTIIPLFRDLWISGGAGYHFPFGAVALITLSTTL